MLSESGKPVGHSVAHTSGRGISSFFQTKVLVLAFCFLIFFSVAFLPLENILSFTIL